MTGGGEFLRYGGSEKEEEEGSHGGGGWMDEVGNGQKRKQTARR